MYVAEVYEGKLSGWKDLNHRPDDNVEYKKDRYG